MVIDTIKGLKYFEVVYRLDNKICIKLGQFRPLLKWSKIAKIGSLDFTSYTFFIYCWVHSIPFFLSTLTKTEKNQLSFSGTMLTADFLVFGQFDQKTKME